MKVTISFDKIFYSMNNFACTRITFKVKPREANRNESKLAAATSFASPQMDWDAPDLITAFTRLKQKCQLMFSNALKDTNDEEKVSYILLWSGEKGMDIFNLL